MAVAQTVQLCIVCIDQTCRFAVKFSSRTTDYIGELGPNDGGGCEIKDEASVIANSTFMREDICIDAFNTGCGKTASIGTVPLKRLGVCVNLYIASTVWLTISWGVITA